MCSKEEKEFELYLLKGPFWWILNPGGFVGLLLFMAYIATWDLEILFFLSVWDSGVDLL